jgi:hypothetical protein
MPKQTDLHLPPELVGRYVTGEINSAELARLAGVSPFKVLHGLRQLGIDTSQSSRKLLHSLRRARLSVGLAPAKIPGKVVELYRKGLSLRQISTRFGLSHEGVRQILLRQGVTLRSGPAAVLPPAV